ncbi:MAG: hypothetical protein A2X42_05230 [Candidatus Margulisbacteria bacterium GWF2_38_17]|nr:MAG: hypothetical protein A2X43_00445 [Candidatus Margulisbacteria bacterium GWD2_39_127]OGI04319.1 MAG: hypothetical protein A2X42_05230 [Candidatus Margulisbacteria bacterium GWF2_38_17]OGI11909.1 MAG: hypothetical protein A2X41_11020 [Candidatus Margulisbacteria bacterium GWE2_39_32]
MSENQGETYKLEITDQEYIDKKKEILSQQVEFIDLEKPTTIAQLVESYGKMSIQARNIGKCTEVFQSMLQDEERPTIMLGIAGPLIAAGLRKVIRDMIMFGLVDVVVSTGAILYQDFYQATGGRHFIGSPEADDTVLRDLLIDRIYDTYVDEEKFWKTDIWLGHFADTLEPRPYSTREFLHKLGSIVEDNGSILRAAYEKGIPVFAPAINDSSIGIGLTDHYYRMRKENRPHMSIDSIRDNYELTQIVVNSKRTSAFYVAGGVPKNYINDSVVMAYIFGMETGGHKYALQVTTDVPHWGGLSGSTLDEATSWGKINTKAYRAMAFVEPSVSLPLIVGSALERKWAEKRSKIQYSWDDDKLTSISYK